MRENEDCLEEFSRRKNAKTSKHEFKNLTEDVKEVKMINRKADESDEAIKEQGKQIEEFHENLKEANKVSIQKLVENKLETKQWSACLKIKVEVLNTDSGKVQGSEAETRTTAEISNERQRDRITS